MTLIEELVSNFPANRVKHKLIELHVIIGQNQPQQIHYDNHL